MFVYKVGLFVLLTLAYVSSVHAATLEKRQLGLSCLCKDSKSRDQPCGSQGCHKGYCWSFCKGAGCALMDIQNEWCYNALTPLGKALTCETDDDCLKHKITYCSGSCSVSAFGIGTPDFDSYCNKEHNVLDCKCPSTVLSANRPCTCEELGNC